MNESISQITIKRENESEDESNISMEKNEFDFLDNQHASKQSSANIRDILRDLKKVVTEQELSIEPDEEEEAEEQREEVTNDSLEDLSYFFLDNQEDENGETCEDDRTMSARYDSTIAALSFPALKENYFQKPSKTKEHFPREFDFPDKESYTSDNFETVNNSSKRNNSTPGDLKIIDPNSFYYKYYHGKHSRLNTPDILDPTSLPETPGFRKSTVSHGSIPKRYLYNPFLKSSNTENRLKIVSSFYGFGQATNDLKKRKSEISTNELATKRSKTATNPKVVNDDSDRGDSSIDSDFESSPVLNVLKPGNFEMGSDRISGFTSMTKISRGIPSMQYGNHLAGLMKKLETLSPYPTSNYYDSYYQKDESSVNSLKQIQDHCKELETEKENTLNDNSKDKLSLEAKYANMTVEEWEAQSEVLMERVSKLLLKVIAFRRKKANLVKALDNIVDTEANELMAQEKELKGSLSRFGNKASEMVLALEDFTQPAKTTKDDEEGTDVANESCVEPTNLPILSEEPNKIYSTEPQDGNITALNQEPIQIPSKVSDAVAVIDPESNVAQSKSNALVEIVEADLRKEDCNNSTSTKETSCGNNIPGTVENIKATERHYQEVLKIDNDEALLRKNITEGSKETEKSPESFQTELEDN